LGVQQATSAEDFLGQPVGRYLTTPNWVAFCATQKLSGFVLWGQPSAADVHALLQLLAVRGSPLASPMARWVDLRRLQSPDPLAFSADYFAANFGLLQGVVTRAAVLHNGGVVAAVVAGFDKVVPTPYPMASFSEPSDALSWLGPGYDFAFVRELDHIQALSAGSAPLVRDLRAWLTTRLCDASLPAAAAALGTSQRSLQRRLREHGASFQDLLIAERIEVAKRLLLETDAQVTTIAYEVGCASVHYFGVLFRRETGSTPTRWRADHRPSAPSCGAEAC
jgi:AraC-like DNA-binding protein